MGAPTKAGMPDGLDIGQGYTLRFTALDPTTGAEVSAVVITAANFTAGLLGQTTADDLLADVPPLWVPIPNDQLSSEGGTS